MNLQASSIRIHEPFFSLEVFLDPYNKRVRVDDFRGDGAKALQKAEELAQSVKVEKLIIKGRKEQFLLLLERGFQCEAMIDQYFLGSDGYFFCKYYSIDRKRSEQWLTEDGILHSIQQLTTNVNTISPPTEYELKLIQEEDAVALAQLYKNVFKIYPTPLHDPEYIKKTINDDGTIYYAFQIGNAFVSAASAEVNSFYKNAELTDCATLTNHRKHGLMKILLEKLEEKLVSKGIFCSYSIARASSFGMNAVLHQLGYHYRGRLINNCYIFETLENMNVWVKDLTTKQITT